ncbi:hypothetical protein D3875_13480 [Deinococcus cavernae]|uniref:Transmembrane protein n=1 Tax=Deinococcus cavernae TaxID=2320857 RepID=A0A418V8K2_9DEIO|nr:DUF6766 family protein [Deinococcus cavernae]RJF72411.1 hypothetical protein D3875_13480 [Deinococcus cavernae]
MKRFWHDNALTIVLMLLFLLFWTAQALSGWAVHNQELQDTHQHLLTFGAYLRSAHFWSATAENWESEFLQMAAFVVLTVYLRQRGSAESKPYPEEETQEDREQEKRDSQVKGFWRRNSLSLVLFALFGASMLTHLLNSWKDYNLAEMAQGKTAETLGQFLHEPEFWFESFQNWQSEFLAVATIVALTIFLRQIGSSQSKGLTEPNRKTGDA